MKRGLVIVIRTKLSHKTVVSVAQDRNLHKTYTRIYYEKRELKTT